jgi:transposase-like protein
MTDLLKNPIFSDETAAREWLEARVWPGGPVCPHCGATDENVTKLEGKAHRPGLYQCTECREQFTVTVKTVFERSKIPLTKWLAALFLMRYCHRCDRYVRSDSLVPCPTGMPR